ncbi:MAG: hypothetical protein J6J60_02335 [Clostridia bacterium]|nr:hypothetical protein [Clostridia bacterium]
MNLTEEPIILNETNDFLGSLEKANSIAKFIETDSELLSKNNMIAIYGEWGNGKSSLMKTIAEKLENDKYEKIWIDMWREESDYSNLSIKILNKILEKIKLDDSTRKGLLQAFIILGKGINVNIPLVSYDMEKAFEQLEKEIDPSNNMDNFIKTFQDKVKKYIEKKNKKIIVFIDDLDRCNSENMLNIIYNIKLLLSVQDIIFIFGIDKKAVSLALMNKYNNEENKAESFLDKIFPVSFNMPNKAINLSLFLKASLGKLDENKISVIEEFLTEINFINPRKLKKVFFRYYLVRNQLIEKKLLDEEKVWNIIWVLFFIIESEFEQNNYLYMIKNKKMDLLGSKLEFETSHVSIRKKIAFNDYKISLRKAKGEKTIYIPVDLFQFMLNPDDLIKDRIDIFGIENALGVVIETNLWLELYKDSISKRFTLYFNNNYSKCIEEMGTKLDKFLVQRKEILEEINKWL